ncbi:MAG: 3-hydroxyacyl-CoA dehydrogenase family protein, partial [Deltaproteobacteria bacterium]
FAGADFKEIDKSWMLNQNDPIGPFGMLDGVGLNLVMDIVVESVNREKLPSNPKIAAALAAYLQPFLDRGDLGMKTGRGFYDYPEPEFQTPEFLANAQEETALSAPMVYTVLATALTLVAEDYAEPHDVDKSWMLTHNPECGPFGTIDAIGLDVVREGLQLRAEQMEAIMGNPGTVYEMTKIATGFLDGYIQKEELGMKSGKGFYSYPNPEYQKPHFLEG